MKKSSSKLKKAQKKKLRKIFLRVVVITLIICAGIIGAGAVLYNQFLYSGDGSDKDWSLNKPLDPINKNLAVFGVDEDVIAQMLFSL